MAEEARVKIFVVEDDPWYSKLLEHQLTLNPEHDVRLFSTAKSCIAALHESPSIVTVDYSLPDMNGRELLKKIKDYDSDIQVIIISGQEDITTALSLLKEGAYDYIVKDEDEANRLSVTVNNIRKTLHLRKEIAELR